MVIFTAAHWAYLFITVLLFILIIRKKEVIGVGIAGIILVSCIYLHSITGAIQALCQSILVGFRDLLPIFIGISLILTMTNAIKASGMINILIKPLSKLNIRPTAAFLTIGLAMFILSLLIWPSPAVALIGALLIPLAGKMNLNTLYIASAINIFGHGIALSGDFFIQGVPSIAGESAGLQSKDLMPYLVPLWLVMGVSTVIVSVIRLRRDCKKEVVASEEKKDIAQPEPANRKKAVISLGITAALFAVDVVAMIIMNITGDEATYLVSGTALLAACVICWIQFGRITSAVKVRDCFTNGFSSTMKIFAPALIMIAFFSLGNESVAQSILGTSAPGFLGDFVHVMVSGIKIPDALLAVVQTVIGTIYSIDGSGFAGLTVIGEIAQGYGTGAEQVKLLVSLGQIVIIWVGGGTLIPWSIIPVASVCKVSPLELAKKNLIPVVSGLLLTTAVAAVWLCIL